MGSVGRVTPEFVGPVVHAASAENEGHYARDCRQSAPVWDLRICYHCHQVGHLRVNCPQLAAGPVQAPSPATLRITGGGQDGAEPPRAQGRAFQLIAEEVRAVSDAAAGMFLS